MGRTADAIAEGLQIADAAARLNVRNRILVDTIAHDESFDVDRFTELAAETLRDLADEQENAADLVRRQRKRAWGRHSDPHGTHDYRDRDTGNLRKRHKQYRGVARKLREQAEDPEAVRRLVEAARDDAWGDVAANLERRLRVEAMRPEQDPDYERLREARMDALKMIDLPRLEAHRRGAAEADPSR